MSRTGIAALLAFTLGLVPLPARAQDGSPDVTFDAPITTPFVRAVEPTLAVDALGRPHLAWSELFGAAEFRIFYARSSDDRGTFGVPTFLAQGGLPDQPAPRVAIAGPAVSVVWTNRTGAFPSEVVVRRSVDGALFDPELSLSGPHGARANLAGDPSGLLIAAWFGREPSDPGVWIRRSLDGGAAWEPRRLIVPAPIDPGLFPEAGPRVAIAPSANVYLAWRQVDASGIPRIWFSRSLDGGLSFSFPVTLSTGSVPAGNPALTAGSGGRVHVVWEESAALTGAARVILYSRSVDSGGTFSAPVPVSSHAAVPTLVARAPQVTAVGPDLVVVAFVAERTLVEADIVLRLSRDGGATFGSPQIVNDGPASTVDPPALAGGRGAVFVAWVGAGGVRPLLLRRGTVTTPPVAVDFDDLPANHWARPWIEALVRAGVTAGCSVVPPRYCPDAPVTRGQIAVFLLRAVEGSTFTPPSCQRPLFADVPCSSPFAAWIQELARRGVTAGCGGGAYCPGVPVTRDEMAVFLLRAREGAGFAPSACAGRFVDVPCSSPFAPWIEELLRRGIASGCDPARYCPGAPVTRAQMAVFLVKTFGLPL